MTKQLIVLPRMLPRILPPYALRALSGVLLLLVLSIAATSSVYAGVPNVITFDELPAGTHVVNQFDGLTFLHATDSNSGGALPLTIVQPIAGTVSGSQALEAHFERGCEFCGTQLVMQFDEAQGRISLSTGVAPDSRLQFSNGAALLLQGYTADPTKPGAQLLEQSVTPCLGKSSTAITTPLTILDDAARIQFAMLSLVDCTDATNSSSGPDSGTILLDNLLYARPLNPPAREHDAPLVTITAPQNGAVVIGTPGSSLVTLQAMVIETAIYSITAQVNGNPPVALSFYQTDPQTFQALTTLTGDSGIISGTNTVMIQVWDFDQPQQTGSATSTFTFRTTPFPPPSQVDIWPTAYEVNQSIDHGPQNLGDVFLSEDGFELHVLDHPLIQGKPTLVRIYAAASGTTTPIKAVPAVMDVERDHCSSNCEIASRLTPMASATKPALGGLDVPPFSAADSDPNVAATDLRKSWNFLLQPGWTNQDLVVTIQVNAGNYSGFPSRDAVPECRTGIASQCLYNNQVKLHLHFVPPPQIVVTPVYIHVTGTYKGATYDNVTPPESQVDAIFIQLNELYPSQVIRGPRYDITVKPDINRDDLLNKIQDFSGITPCFALPTIYHFYLGLFPGSQGNFAANKGDFPGSIVVGYASVGIPFCGKPGAWANADNPIDAAHELGHNVGMPHWGCENGVEGNGCDKFPIEHAGIGGVGFDFAGWRVIPPGDNSANNTPHAHDFMSYGALCSLSRFGGGPGCDLGEWVSWYTQDILRTHPGLGSYDASDPPALLISGRIAPTGTVTFRPAYQINSEIPISDTIDESHPQQIYTLQGYDAEGNVLFAHNFQAELLDEHNDNFGKTLAFAQPVPLLPNLQRLALFKDEQLLGELTNPAPGQRPSVEIHTPDAGDLWSAGSTQTISWTAVSPASLPLFALVEYSPDGGTTRTVLGRDLTVPSLTVDADQLAGSTNAFLFVQVSDGINTASAKIGPFTVAPKVPEVHILTPQPGDQLTANLPLTLLGTGFDRQEDLRDEQFKWSLDQNKALGSGRQLTLPKLSAGPHTITLTVTDSQKRTGKSQVQVQVQRVPWLYVPMIAK